uniref:cryptochrome/photolyase family protein n=1 Tax=Henriciella litoralis TaxID=568102 RepID=UPI002D21C690|nr:deoxyribodipyrimidine photo-lyase [Henriciella litoralis]
MWIVTVHTSSEGAVALAASNKKPVIVWFRNDLRLNDHAALAAAMERGGDIYPVYILEDGANLRARGGASKWWLDKSLKSLRSDISEKGGKLICRCGDARKIIPELVDEIGAGAVYWGRRYGKPEREIDSSIKSALTDDGIEAKSFNTCLLTEPWSYETTSGGYYKVFTPYWKSVKATYSAPSPFSTPESFSGAGIDGDRIEDWGLHPENPDWSEGFSDLWQPGEAGAKERLSDFLDDGLRSYKTARDRPDISNGTSGLSPHLAHGEISPAQIWRSVTGRINRGLKEDDSAWTFLSEVVWREFSYVLYYHNPDFGWENYNKKFDEMPWRKNKSALEAWQDGQTGYPIVDAGLRQLWHTGWMHNRVRMIVASLLTKHLLIHWRDGETWFWDTLVDADPASNAAGWQWTAGSGADASPYFRIFNPITQGQKFDETGKYVRKWCPELKDLPGKYLHAPWEAPSDVLEKAGVKLGDTYPKPIIKHAEGRQKALDAWDTLKEKQDA